MQMVSGGRSYDLAKMPRARCLEMADVAVLVLADAEGAITRAEVQDTLGYGFERAITRLRSLVDGEFMMEIGRGRNRAYGLTPNGRRVVMGGRQ